MTLDPVVRLLGLPGLVLQGDPMVMDRWQWVKRHISSGPLRTLDAGCGSGAFTLYATQIGNDAVGMSYQGANTAKAIRRSAVLGLGETRFITADLRHLDEIASEFRPFDQILCLEVIEHVLNDRKLIGDLTSLLAPCGKLILSTPYKHYHPLLSDQLSRDEDGGHVRWGYTHDEIREIFEGHGLDVACEGYLSGWVTQIITNGQRWLKLHGLHPHVAWALALPLRVLQPLDRLLTAALRYPYATIGVVGVKRAV
jgi:SAM-dependent methyltransferase